MESKKIRPSRIRVLLLSYLQTHCTHPTIDEMYEYLAKEITSPSRTSIYNTMKLFLDYGLIRHIGIDEKSAHYDANLSPHAHFLCRKCERVFDLWLDARLFSNVANAIADGKLVETSEIYYKGVCKDCRKDS